MNLLRRVLPTACGLLLVLTPAGLASSGSPVTEYPLPTSGQAPTGIVSAPDGRLWFAEGSTNVLGAISTKAKFKNGLSGLSGAAHDVAAGRNNDVWFTEPAVNKVGNYSLSTDVLHEFSTAGTAPWDLTVDPSGNAWFTEQGGSGGIGEITTSGTVVDYTSGLPSSSRPAGITAGPDGNVWFTDEAGSGAIGRITPSGQITEFTAGLTVGAPTSIVAGPDGNLWFTESAGSGAIGRITPSGQITEFTAGLAPSAHPAGLTVGPDGNLYFTDSGNPGSIGEITPGGTITEVEVASPTTAPDTIASGPDGNLWFTEPGAPGQIGEIAPGLTSVASSVASSTGSTAGSTPGSGSGPAAVSEPASHVTPAAARLNGASPDAVAGDTYHFDWGTTPAYGASTHERTITKGTIRSRRQLSAQLGGLAPDTTYHFRLVVSDCGGCASGTTDGADMTFHTGTAPIHIGQQGIAGGLSGMVEVQRPGTHHLVALAARQDVPVGSLVDATRGHLRLTTQLPGGATQSATVWGGQFVMRQNSHSGMTTFTLVGALGCPTPSTTMHRALVRWTTARRPTRRPRTRSLWAHDNHGLYTTRGNNSVATVRGTVWETVETCAGTRTVVARGVVAVRDLRRHRTVLVRAGHSYLARR